jgi:trypsin-like peptidase
MFADAVRRATNFTLPLFSSFSQLNGDITSGNGSMVIVNQEGWFLTAAHVFDPWRKLQKDVPTVRAYLERRASIEQNRSLDPKHKRKQLAKLVADEACVDSCTFWWIPTPSSQPQPLAATTVFLHPQHDLALGRLDNFDVRFVREYPIFKRPGELQPGTSLCRLGFPFTRLQTTIRPVEGGRKEVDVNVAELTLFPNEGILTRIATAGDFKEPGQPIPQFIETSSPGLRGQSGGPIFDRNGVVWGIQSRTNNISLGFDPPDPANPTRTIHQYLNVGWAVHPAVVRWALTSHGVKFADEAEVPSERQDGRQE